jgi:hypothetical protein
MWRQRWPWDESHKKSGPIVCEESPQAALALIPLAALSGALLGIDPTQRLQLRRPRRSDGVNLACGGFAIVRPAWQVGVMTSERKPSLQGRAPRTR